MQYTAALDAARRTADLNLLPLALVRDPISHREEDGPWNYCPVEEVRTLFPHADLFTVIRPGRPDLPILSASLIGRIDRKAMTELTSERADFLAAILQHADRAAIFAALDAHPEPATQPTN